MADFENYAGTAANIALQIERKLVVLNVDWHDEAALRRLAHEALQYDKNQKFPGFEHGGADQLAHMEICGLIALMNKTITEGAIDGQDIHGSEVWKALAKVLWAEKNLSESNGST
jgi:hypothetical protein